MNQLLEMQVSQQPPELWATVTSGSQERSVVMQTRWHCCEQEWWFVGRVQRRLQHQAENGQMLLKIQSLMSPQSQMVCTEMARDEKSARLKFRGCLEISAVGETVRERIMMDWEGRWVRKVKALEEKKKTLLRIVYKVRVHCWVLRSRNGRGPLLCKQNLFRVKLGSIDALS